MEDFVEEEPCEQSFKKRSWPSRQGGKTALLPLHSTPAEAPQVWAAKSHSVGLD